MLPQHGFVGRYSRSDELLSRSISDYKSLNDYLDCKYLYCQCVHLGKAYPSLWVVSEFKIKKPKGMDVSLSLCESLLKPIIFVLTV